MPRISTSYSEIWWPEEDGEYEEEHGWVDEEGSEIEGDDEESVVDAAVKFLSHEGGTCPSSSAYHRGLWWHWHDAQQDFRTGRYREQSYHLDGFTEEQERAIYDRLAK